MEWMLGILKAVKKWIVKIVKKEIEFFPIVSQKIENMACFQNLKMSFHFIIQDLTYNEMIGIIVGQEFDNVQHFRRVLQNYVLKHGFDLNKIKNEKRMFRAKCSNEGYLWFIYAAQVESGIKFKIQKLNDVHECHGVLESKEASYKWIASQFEGTLKNNPKMPVKAIKDVDFQFRD
ncbi:hypothetical protein WN943_004283 [Citrus x changshan-huyou]